MGILVVRFAVKLHHSQIYLVAKRFWECLCSKTQHQCSKKDTNYILNINHSWVLPSFLQIFLKRPGFFHSFFSFCNVNKFADCCSNFPLFSPGRPDPAPGKTVTSSLAFPKARASARPTPSRKPRRRGKPWPPRGPRSAPGDAWRNGLAEAPREKHV